MKSKLSKTFVRCSVAMAAMLSNRLSYASVLTEVVRGGKTTERQYLHV